MMPNFTPPAKIAVATAGIINNNALLAKAIGVDINFAKKSPQATAVLAWGQKPSAKKAHRLAKTLNLPLITAEDGFLRSLDSGTQSKFGASFIIDDVGVYFDLTSPNRLQALIFDTMRHWTKAEECRTKVLIDKILDNHLSKYNTTTTMPDLSRWIEHHTYDTKECVLVIDQVAGDASIVGAGADEQVFFDMLASALKNHVNSPIFIKAHPAGKGILVNDGKLSPKACSHLQKAFDNDARHDERIFVLDMPCNPILLLKQIHHIYTVSSHMGFEALMLNSQHLAQKTIHCFGVNWYSGFGLTDDTYIKPKPLYQQVLCHHKKLGADLHLPTIHQLFFASYIRYSYYANPATGKACQIDDVIDYLILNRHWRQRFGKNVLAYEFSRWKKPFVQGFLGFGSTRLKIHTKILLADSVASGLMKRQSRALLKKIIHPATADKSNAWRYVTWGQKSKQKLQQNIHQFDPTHCAKIFCMEDGFIRSNGLGATLLAPLSVVMDETGIYYDATSPSDLERILQSIALSEHQIQRAQNLIAIMKQKRVSKYNVQASSDEFLAKINALKAMRNRPVHLVIGQVEDDASVQSCTSVIKKNAELLKRVRQDYPEDIVVYKPHPDIEAGLRVGRVDAETLKIADVVAYHTPMPDCLDVVDVVHTISSLTGFEALIRGLSVVCYGLPFYAGFGLTHDIVEPDNLPKHAALNRRKRHAPLSIEALVFGTLVDYPIYHLPHGYGLAKPEEVIDYLYTHANQPSKSWVQRAFRQAKTRAMQLRKVFKR